jgi:hypothetical protein
MPDINESAFNLEEWCEAHFEEVRTRGDGSCMVRCPAHDDNNPSLHVSIGERGDRVVLRDFAGCSAESILVAANLTWEDLWFAEAPGDHGLWARRVPELSEEEAVFRDGLYRVLLCSLELSEQDRDSLLGRGLRDKDIKRNGYRTLTPESSERAVNKLIDKVGMEAAQKLPGVAWYFYQHPKHGKQKFSRPAVSSGLLIPVRDDRRRIIACQVRTGNPDRKYVWFSGQNASSGAPAHVPAGVRKIGEKVRVIEGPLKADVVHALDPSVPTLAVPGVANWQKILPVLKRAGVKQVQIAFDADCQTNENVLSALGCFGCELRLEGYDVLVEFWKLDQGKGLDDLLLNGGTSVTFAHDFGRTGRVGSKK